MVPVHRMSRFITIAAALLAGALGAAVVFFFTGGPAPSPVPSASAPTATPTATHVPTWTPTPTPTPTITPTLTLEQQAEEWWYENVTECEYGISTCHERTLFDVAEVREECQGGYWMSEWMRRALNCALMTYMYDDAIRHRPTPTPDPTLVARYGN